jgi:hypothetical protein
MAWGQLRRDIWKHQQGLCGVCHKPVKLSECVIHHRRNASNGGKETFSNGQARHRDCETWAHQNYRCGNPEDYHNTLNRKGKRNDSEMKVWRYYVRTGRLP